MKIFSGSIRRSILYCKNISRWSSTGTVKQDEIEKFGKMAEKWWELNGPVGGLHKFNAVRVPMIKDWVLSASTNSNTTNTGPHPLKGFKLIDIGCGAGILSEALARIGAQVTGLDATKELVDTAKYHAKSDSSLNDVLQYVNMTVEEHAVENSCKYDAVVCSEVIEHVNNPYFFMEQCVKLAKPGGSLVFTTINKTWLANFWMITLAENIMGIIPKGTHEYEMFIPPKDLRQMFENNNCEVRNQRGYMFLMRAIISDPTCSCMYGMHAVKR